MRDSSVRSRPALRVGCLVFGHDYRFTAEGPTMRWACSRGCGAGDEKIYANAGDAARYARAFDRRDSQDLGRRAPLIGLLPLRMWRKIRNPNDRGSS